MKLFHKAVSVVLAATLCVTGISACGSSNQNNQNSSSAVTNVQASAAETDSSGEKVNLKFWDMAWGADYQVYAEKLVKKYNDEHPNVEVSYQSIPWANFYQTFTTAISSGTAPDVSTGGGYQQHEFDQMGEILPLDSIVDEWKAEGKTDDFIPGSLKQFQNDSGVQIGIPWMAGVRAVFYRKDMFEKKGIKVPETWDDFEKAAIVLTDGDVYGFVSPASDTLGYWAMANFIYGMGGHIVNADRKADFACSENVDAISMIQRLAKAKAVPSSLAGYTVDDAQKMFMQGKAAMIYDDNNFINAIKDTSDDFKKNIGVLPVLADKNGEKRSPGGLNAIMAYKQTKHPEESKQFVKWWSENMTSLFSEGKLAALPVRQSIMKDPCFEENEFISGFKNKVMPYFCTTNQPVQQAFVEMSGFEGELLLRDAYQASLDISSSPENVANSINERVKEIMGE